MASVESTGSNDEDAKIKQLEETISELRLAKKEVVEKRRPLNEELERIRISEQQHVAEINRLKEKKYDRTIHCQLIKRLSELEFELKRTKFENTRLLDKNIKLKQVLDQSTRYSKMQKLKINELNSRVATVEKEQVAKAESVDIDTVEISLLQEELTQRTKLLNETVEKLNTTRQQLSDVKERLTVSEQVTAATQQRKIQEFGNSEDLQLELTSHQRPTTCTGCVLLQQLNCSYYAVL